MSRRLRHFCHCSCPFPVCFRQCQPRTRACKLAVKETEKLTDGMVRNSPYLYDQTWRDVHVMDAGHQDVWSVLYSALRPQFSQSQRALLKVKIKKQGGVGGGGER